jgi:hypothetical protein
MLDTCFGQCKPEARATACDEDVRDIKLWVQSLRPAILNVVDTIGADQ